MDNYYKVILTESEPKRELYGHLELITVQIIDNSSVIAEFFLINSNVPSISQVTVI